MQRRNFLQALLAAGSALAGARAVTAAVALPEPSKAVSPKAAVAANTQPLRQNIESEAQRTVMEMLKECRVLNLESSVDIRAASSWRVTYRHDPDAPRTSLDDEAKKIHETRVPVSVMVTSLADDNIDVWNLHDTTKQTYEIQVEWR
jgi:hypothetical protein